MSFEGDFIVSPEVSNIKSLHYSVLDAKIAGADVHVGCKIMTSFRTYLDFTFWDKLYEFDIYDWANRAHDFLCVKFHSSSRDHTKFGCVRDDGTLDISPTQKLQITIQAAKDVISCLDIILLAHKLKTLDYALWYICKYHPQTENGYSSYITKITCTKIIQNNFMCGDSNFDVTEFSPG